MSKTFSRDELYLPLQIHVQVTIVIKELTWRKLFSPELINNLPYMIAGAEGLISPYMTGGSEELINGSKNKLKQL